MRKKKTKQERQAQKMEKTEEKIQAEEAETAEEISEAEEVQEGIEAAPDDENAGEAASEESLEEKLSRQLAEANDKYLRLMAEYDNFRKRSAKERLELSASVTGDAVSGFLPVFDNFERALQAETSDAKYKEGVEMIFKQFSEVIAKLGVEIIDPTGEVFDPNTSNAVSQIEDPELGENVVAQTFQKGYRIGGKVIRYAMVAVANP